MASGQAIAVISNVSKLHGFWATKTIVAFLYFPLLPEYAALFAQPFVLMKQLSVVRRHLGLFGKHPDPLDEGRMPNPQIRRNLTTCQAAGLCDANRITIELVAVYRGYFRSP